MPITIDPKAGADHVLADSTVPAPDAWSVYFWFRKATGTQGQWFSVGTSLGHIESYVSGGVADRWTLDRLCASNTAQWNCTVANQGVTYNGADWIFMAVTQVGNATPKLYTACPAQSVVLASRTVTTAVAPSGAATTSAGEDFYIGNYEGLDYALGGDMAYLGYHNVELSQAEIKDAMARGYVQRGLVFATPLASASSIVDVSNDGYTFTGSGISDASLPDAPLESYTASVAPLGDDPLGSVWLCSTTQFSKADLSDAGPAVWTDWVFGPTPVSGDVTITAVVASLTGSIPTPLAANGRTSPAALLSLDAPAAALSHTVTAPALLLTHSAPAPAQSHGITAVVADLTASSPAPSLSHTLVAPAALVNLSVPATAQSHGLTSPAALLTHEAPTPTVAWATVLQMAAAARIDAVSPTPTIVMSDQIDVPAASLVTFSAGTITVSDSITAPSADMAGTMPAPVLTKLISAPSGLLTLSAPASAQSDSLVAPSATVTLSAPTPGATAAVTIQSIPAHLGQDAASPTIPGSPVVVVAPSGTLTMEIPLPTLLGTGGAGEGTDLRWLLHRRKRLV